jgi:hypothetical protein
LSRRPGFSGTDIDLQLKQHGIELGRSRLEAGVGIHESPGPVALADVM